MFKKKRRGKGGHWTADLNDKLRMLKLCPLVQDSLWEVELVHKEPCYHFEALAAEYFSTQTRIP